MTHSAQFDPEDVLAHLARGQRRRSLIHTHTVPARAASTADFPPWVDPALYAALTGSGICALWSHQRHAADSLWSGEHVAVATGTASGKSLGYLLPTLTSLASGLEAPTGRGSTALYLAPTKALAADHEARIRALAIPGLRAATYDGDTPSEERRWIRDHAHLVLTNPDLLHASLLPGHSHWAPFLRRLDYVIVDESHVYRGVFGAQVALVLRRLLRVAARYGADPTLAFASATSANPGEHASALAGFRVRAITEDGSAREAVTFALWEPPLGQDGKRRSAVAQSGDLLTDLVDGGIQTVVFARSRTGVEVVADIARRGLSELSPHRVDTIAAYRGGYLPEDRRDLETALRSGEVMGLAATTALELGIDVAGLDAVVLAGWPGTLSSMWQQAGRAGRVARPSLAVLVAADDPLDSYLIHHPERIFSDPIEAGVIDPENPRVLAQQLAAAAAELPLTDADVRWFGPTMTGLADSLVTAKVLRRRPGGWFWARQDRAADHVSLRGTGTAVRIVESATGRVLGTVDEARAPAAVHTGAVYVHQGQTYLVTELDLNQAQAVVVRGDPGWNTHAASVSDFRLLATSEVPMVQLGPGMAQVGEVEVTSHVTSFLRRLPSGEVIGQHSLDLPVRRLRTRGVWWTLPVEAIQAAGVSKADAPGALHAAEHAAIGMLPLVATCDRWDIGGVSTLRHVDTDEPTVLVYDGHPGGAGLADRGFAALRPWLVATLSTIEDCSCTTGCPSCVQSPKCGNGNDPLDKTGAVRVLRALVVD
ncbi:MAG: DEAD/DEAH box helicase [Ornithinimicrobium sp.]